MAIEYLSLYVWSQKNWWNYETIKHKTINLAHKKVDILKKKELVFKFKAGSYFKYTTFYYRKYLYFLTD